MLTRSIKYEYKQLWKPALGFFLVMPLLAFVSFFAKDYLAPLLELMVEWPREMFAFFGMSGLYNGNHGLLIFYLALIFTNMFALAVCVNSADMMNADEECGVTIFYVNQPYTKTQIFFIRLAWYLLSAVIKWWIYIGAVAVSLELLCRKLGTSAELGLVYEIGWKGLPFLLFACGLAVVYSMLPSRGMNYRDFVLVISFLGFVVGNAYKVTDYIAYWLRSEQKNADSIAQISKNLKTFRSAYPFTLMNVLNTEKKPLPEQVPLVYAGIGLLFLLLGWWMYHRKSLVEE